MIRERRKDPHNKTISIHLAEEDYLKFRQLAYFHNRTLTNEALYEIFRHIKNVKKSSL